MPAAVAVATKGNINDWDPRRLPGVQSVSADEVVQVLPPVTAAIPATSPGETAGEAHAASRFWGLDRINQGSLLLNIITLHGCYPLRGTGVTAYFVGSELKVEHAQFSGPGSLVAPGEPYLKVTSL